ncbi:MAG: XdhC family protein [Acidimicrobiia bacterium]|nr:XdhC family protein [Acidimicrobiia bacterium]
MFERIAELRSQGHAFAVATVTWRRAPSSAKVGSRAIIRPDGTVEGWMGGACSQPTLVRAALESLETGRAQLVVLGEHDHRPDVVNVPMACSSEGAMEVYMEPVLPAPKVHIVGSSPMTATLGKLVDALDWQCVVTEDVAMEGVDRSTHVIVATQGHFDEQALERALATEARSIGLVASEKRASSVIEWLRNEGLPDEAMARLRAPVGIDLGHTEHDGIAVSILAELVRIEAEAHPTAPVIDAPEQAIDPVCEMVVDVATARWTFDHEGTTYYFCAPGCQKAFSNDPAAFL